MRACAERLRQRERERETEGDRAFDVEGCATSSTAYDVFRCFCMSDCACKMGCSPFRNEAKKKREGEGAARAVFDGGNS